MPKYKCKNKKCKKFNKEQIVAKSISKFVDGKIIDSASLCPKCDAVMESIDPAGFTTHMTGSDNICKK